MFVKLLILCGAIVLATGDPMLKPSNDVIGNKESHDSSNKLLRSFPLKTKKVHDFDEEEGSGDLLYDDLDDKPFSKKNSPILNFVLINFYCKSDWQPRPYQTNLISQYRIDAIYLPIFLQYVHQGQGLLLLHFYLLSKN